MKQLIGLIALFCVAPAWAQSQNLFHATVSTHSEARSGVHRGNLDAAFGLDHLVDPEDDTYIGARFGLYREEVLDALPTNGVHSHFLFGAQAYRYFGISEGSVVKLGAAVDLITQVPHSQFSAYIGVLAGLRFFTYHNFYAEIPLELGTWPAFDGIGVFAKFGFQMGVGF